MAEQYNSLYFAFNDESVLLIGLKSLIVFDIVYYSSDKADEILIFCLWLIH